MRCRIVNLDVSCFCDGPADSREANLVLLEVEEPHFCGVYASAGQAALRLAKLGSEEAGTAPETAPARFRPWVIPALSGPRPTNQTKSLRL